MPTAERRILLGNEAIARGVVESGCHFMASYPGTPSSEILPAVVQFKQENGLDIYVEWSTNEKVALENALVASYTGKRAAVATKKVEPKDKTEKPVPVEPPPAGKKTISEGKEMSLPPDQASSVLTKIQEEMKGGPSRRLTITWRVDEDKKQQ